MGATTITGRETLHGRRISLVVKDGVIERVFEPADAGSEASDLFLAHGLVDLQVNGYADLDVNAPQLTPSVIIALVDAMLSQGVTSFAPTIITAPEEQLCHALATIAAARRIYPRVAACIPFVHVEGPHISPLDGYRGAHPADSVRPPSKAEFARWQRAAQGCVGMVTLSPHFTGSTEYIAELVRHGVHVAIGHTHASAAQIQTSVDAGARLSTHLGNAIAPEIPRHHNPIWPQLADDRLTASFIADGHHLPPEVLKAMLRAKTVERSILVSDSVSLAGMPAGSYTTPVGGKVELHPDGRLCILGSELLAGATASLASCLGNLVRMTGITLHDALLTATRNPGRFAGDRGQMTPGSRADILRFRWKDGLLVEDVWLAGEQVYKRNETATGNGVTPA